MIYHNLWWSNRWHNEVHSAKILASHSASSGQPHLNLQITVCIFEMSGKFALKPVILEVSCMSFFNMSQLLFL